MPPKIQKGYASQDFSTDDVKSLPGAGKGARPGPGTAPLSPTAIQQADDFTTYPEVPPVHAASVIKMKTRSGVRDLEEAERGTA